jgi:AraC-like DNA-binding protein
LAIDTQGLNTIWNEFSQGWLGIGFIYVPLRMILTLGYWIWQVKMIIRSGKVKEGQNLIAENKNIIAWVKILCASQVLFFVPYYINAFFGSQQNLFFVLHVLLAIAVSITILLLIMQPSILYGLKGIVIRKLRDDPEEGSSPKPIIIKDHTPVTTVKTVSENVVDDIYLSGQKVSDLGERLTEHILLNRTYLKKGCTSSELAAEMNLQPYILSAVINSVFRTNFNDFINGYRVDHAKSLIQNGEARILTLEALSEQCGFNNRNSFTMAFKKHTGQTPSDFIKQIQTA